MLLPESVGPVSATMQCKSKVCGVCAACRRALKEVYDDVRAFREQAEEITGEKMVTAVASSRNPLVQAILDEPRPKKARPKVRAVQNRRKKEPT